MNNNVFFFWLTCIAAIKHTLRRILVRPVQVAAKCRLAYTFIITSAFILCSFIADAQQTRLIIRADDMGITHATNHNHACRDAFTKGVAKSVEIMAPSPWFPEAVKYLNENPGYDGGIYLAITSEWNNLKWRPLTHAPSLTYSNGYFYSTIWNGFPELHTPIMNVKGWLKGTHHKCKGNRLQQYLDEFHCRFNRRTFLGTIPDKLIGRAMALSQIPYSRIRVCQLNT